MIYVEETLISIDDQQATAGLNLVRAYLYEHGTAIANASYLLGGASASGAVFRLMEAVRDARRLAKAHVRQLQRTLALLMLENVGDPDRTETALFADLVPGSRIVEEICLLADALDYLLMQLDQITDAAASDQEVDHANQYPLQPPHSSCGRYPISRGTRTMSTETAGPAPRLVAVGETSRQVGVPRGTPSRRRRCPRDALARQCSIQLALGSAVLSRRVGARCRGPGRLLRWPTGDHEAHTLLTYP
jgi:hypothetical protein